MIYLCDSIDKSLIESVADGDGLRLVLFLQHCIHHCKNCHNKTSWAKTSNYKYSIDELFEIISKELKCGYFDGITFSGGDPLLQSDELIKLIKLIKSKFDVNIWIYTGFLYEEVKDKEILKYIDVLVDGKYEEENKYPKKKYRGSNNQRLLHLKNGIIIKEE